MIYLTLMDPVSQLFLLTLGRVLVGVVMMFVLVGSLYQFRKAILTMMGVLLLSNLLCLYIVLGMLTT